MKLCTISVQSAFLERVKYENMSILHHKHFPDARKICLNTYEKRHPNRASERKRESVEEKEETLEHGKMCESS